MHRQLEIERNVDLHHGGDLEPYPNAYEDPDPPPTDLQPDELGAHRRIIFVFGDEIYLVLTSETGTVRKSS